MRFSRHRFAGLGLLFLVRRVIEPLLASATCKANIARAKELIAAPLPSIDPSAVQEITDVAAAAADDRSPCPCCGGRMIIVESFRPGGQPRAPPSQAGVATATP